MSPVSHRSLFRLFKARHALLCLIALLPGLGVSVERADPDQLRLEWPSCLQRLENSAIAAGFERKDVKPLLANLEFREDVVRLDRNQPEFTTPFQTYLAKRVTDFRIQKGREMWRAHRQTLESVTRDTGVPPAYLLSFWGLETNFGGYKGNIPALEALGTLACEGRRGEFFEAEWLAALEIIKKEEIPPENLEGSWAGALGHVQFMPSVYLRYAQDGDGDGRANLFASIPDALRSAGHFLAELGWKRGLRWGREVILPPDFNYRLAGLSRREPLQFWADLGVRNAFGSALDLSQPDLEASLVVPSGHQGPAFLVYSNFRVIMRWNYSEYYALAVGHLADRIAGAAPLQRPPAEAPRLSREAVRQLQRQLIRNNFLSGKADGYFGPKTRDALASWQAQQNMVADGFPGNEVLERLQIESSSTD